jgi:pimeloyl-ACP methyl ester carboxylesterase
MLRHFALLAAAAVTLTAAVFAFVEGPDYYDAYLLLNDVAAGTGPSPLKSDTPQPKREAVPWYVDGRSDWGDLYSPADGDAKARLVLVPGLAQGGKDDPRVVAFAEGFARLAFLVLVPEVEGLRELRASPTDAVELADAVIHLTRLRAAGLEPGQSGIAAISYGVGPAILAALDPRAKDKVSFVLGIGGYADMIESVTYVTAGYERDGPGSPWREGTPNIYGRWAFVFANAQRVDSENDRATLKAIAERKFENPDADISDLTPTLGPEGRSVFALLDNRDPNKVAALIDQLPQAIQADLHGLDLAKRDLSGMEAQVLLIHGEDDTIIPVTQSKRLAVLLPPGKAELFLPEHFMHIEFQEGLSYSDMLTLWSLGKRLMEFRSDWKPIQAVLIPKPIIPVDRE